MLRGLLLLLATATLAALSAADSHTLLHKERASPGDLELGGELAGLPSGATRYIRYEDLLSLPQETYTVSDDTNLAPKTVISGVALTTLARLFGSAPKSDLVVAICDDAYRTSYPRDYLAAHHPLLVLRINGRTHDQWPRVGNSETGDSTGPYLISHPLFKPAFKVLSHEDEPQIPYGVVRIEIRRESVVLGAIRPRGTWPPNSPVEQGYTIARQDCFRCHNRGVQGGTKGDFSWHQIGIIARTDATDFRRIVRDPSSVTPDAKMPAHTDYDDATLAALTAYFRTFSGTAPHSSAKSRIGRKP